MNPSVVKAVVRARFTFTTRNQANARIRRAVDTYLTLARQLGPEAGSRVVSVPRMIGVDEDMRNWSLFMLLEHNVIVNRSITAVTACLARGEKASGLALIDPKRDVMPSADPGPEQIAALESSVNDHLETVAGLGRLRGTGTRLHPLFGPFNAHFWHCMFGFHLQIHLNQARLIAAG